MSYVSPPNASTRSVNCAAAWYWLPRIRPWPTCSSASVASGPLSTANARRSSSNDWAALRSGRGHACASAGRNPCTACLASSSAKVGRWGATSAETAAARVSSRLPVRYASTSPIRSAAWIALVPFVPISGQAASGTGSCTSARRASAARPSSSMRASSRPITRLFNRSSILWDSSWSSTEESASLVRPFASKCSSTSCAASGAWRTRRTR